MLRQLYNRPIKANQGQSRPIKANQGQSSFPNRCPSTKTSSKTCWVRRLEAHPQPNNLCTICIAKPRKFPRAAHIFSSSASALPPHPIGTRAPSHPVNPVHPVQKSPSQPPSASPRLRALPLPIQSELALPPILSILYIPSKKAPPSLPPRLHCPSPHPLYPPHFQNFTKFPLHSPSFPPRLPTLNRLLLVSLRGESSGESFSVVI